MRKRVTRVKRTAHKRKHPEPQRMHDGSPALYERNHSPLVGRFNYGWNPPFHHNDPRTKILNHLLDIWWEIEYSLDFTDVKWDKDLRHYFQQNVLPRMDDFRVELEEYFKQDPNQQKQATLERLQKELEEMRL
jgi:hypothetical protein